jgi:hypothetical protein
MIRRLHKGGAVGLRVVWWFRDESALCACTVEKSNTTEEHMGNDVMAKRVSEMTGAEARKVIISSVANGMIAAGLVLLLLNFALGFLLASLHAH